MSGNEAAPRYPIAHPSSLSAEAQMVYRSGHSGRVDRDLLDPKTAHRYVPREDAAAFEPSKRLLAAIDELVAVGLAAYDAQFKSLRIIEVHDLYTVAHGRGPHLIEVRCVPVDRAFNPSHEGVLLAVLDGGEMSMRHVEGAWAVAAVEALHPTATDFEHSTAKVARLEVVAPTLLSMYGSHTRYAGTLIDARLYPLGTDPLTKGDADTPVGECDGEGYGEHDPHPFAPFLPPGRREIAALLPSVVRIDISPARR